MYLALHRWPHPSMRSVVAQPSMTPAITGFCPGPPQHCPSMASDDSVLSTPKISLASPELKFMREAEKINQEVCVSNMLVSLQDYWCTTQGKQSHSFVASQEWYSGKKVWWWTRQQYSPQNHVFCAAPVLSPGKNDINIRSCFDQQHLNTITVKDSDGVQVLLKLVDSLLDAKQGNFHLWWCQFYQQEQQVTSNNSSTTSCLEA